MDRWLKTGRLETRHDNRDDSTESFSEVPFHRTKTKEMMIEKGKSENMTATIYNWVFILLGMSRNLNRFVLYVTKFLPTAV